MELTLTIEERETLTVMKVYNEDWGVGRCFDLTPIKKAHGYVNPMRLLYGLLVLCAEHDAIANPQALQSAA